MNSCDIVGLKLLCVCVNFRKAQSLREAFALALFSLALPMGPEGVPAACATGTRGLINWFTDAEVFYHPSVFILSDPQPLFWGARPSLTPVIDL